MTQFTIDVDPWTIAWTGVVQGFGMGFVFVPMSTLAFATLPVRLRTDAAAMYSVIRSVGSSLGISYVVNQHARSVQVSHASLSEAVTPFAPALKLPAVSAHWALDSQASLASLNDEITRQASMIAYLNDFRFMMWVTILALPMVFLLRSGRGVAGAARR
jgi:DHA2 family multidrug resistance protein